MLGGVVYPVSPGQQLSPVPPLVSVIPPAAETVYHGHITSRQRVLVGVDASGVVQQLRVQQRLTIGGVGDYTFTVPGPIADVSALPGSASEPGLRPSGIVWAGFSGGRRELGAEAVVRPARAAAALPLRVRLVGNRLEVRNTTAIAAPIRSGNPDPAVLASVLDAARTALRTGALPETTPVPVRGDVTVTRATVSARLAVDVGYLKDGRRVTLHRVLGGDRPLTLTVPLPSRRGLVVTAAPLAARDPLRPPGGAADWGQAVRRLGAGAALEQGTRQFLEDARTRQWHEYLQNPDPLGASAATYRYTVVARTARVAAPARHHGGSDRTLLVLSVILVPLAAAGLVVAWAHA